MSGSSSDAKVMQVKNEETCPVKDLFFYKTRGTPLFQAAVELKEKAVLLRIADKINRFCRWLSIVSWFHSDVDMYIRKNES